MADEIRVTKKRSVLNGNLRRTKSKSYRQTQTTAKSTGQTQTIGFAAHEAIVMGDVTTPGRIWAENLDGTNFVQIGIDVAGTFHPCVRVMPGTAEEFLMPPTMVPYAKADTAAVELDYELFSA